MASNATPAAQCPFVVHDIDVQIATTLIYVKGASPNECMTKPVSFTKSRYPLQPLGNGNNLNLLGIQVGFLSMNVS